MRPFPLLIICMAVQGCLYLGGINHDPEGEIVLESASAKLEVNGWVTLKAKVSDPDDDSMTFQWRAEVEDLEQRKYALTRASRTSSSDTNYMAGVTPQVIGEQASITLNLLPLRGKYTVSLRFADDRGAAQTKTLTFTVKNSPPSKITLDLMADPAYRDLIKVPDLKGSYPAHAYYLVRINKSIHDVEEDLICGGKGSVTWSLEGGPELKLDYKKEKPCQHKEILGRFHFRYQAADLKKPQPIIIRAKVQDGYGGAGEGVLKVDLAPNRPPCVLGTDPPFFAKTAGANHVAVISAKGLRFEATHLNDDVLLGTRFSWSMRLAGEKAFVVLPGEGTAAFQMPPWFRLPGDQFELRMRVRDSMSGLPACGDASLCAPYPGLPAGCYQGITWKVRML